VKDYNDFNTNIDDIYKMNNKNNMGCIPPVQYDPTQIFPQCQYNIQPMPHSFQDVIGGNFWQWPGALPNYPGNHMNWTCGTPGSPEKLKELIKDALSDEAEDRLFYEYLISTATSNEDKKIIRGIRDDEMKHFEMFKQLYRDLTGQMPTDISEKKFTKPSSYCEGLVTAIMDEQNAVLEYRKILFLLNNKGQINKMIEIITDELRHCTLFNYLYSKNKCAK
jgi:rubrerythrin